MNTDTDRVRVLDLTVGDFGEIARIDVERLGKEGTISFFAVHHTVTATESTETVYIEPRPAKDIVLQ